MKEMELEKRLSRAAIEGDTQELKEIIKDDKLVVKKIIVGALKTNPLHEAISRDQVKFVKELLMENKELAEVLDSGRTPLHLAAAKGNLDIVNALIVASRDMCLARDPEGRNPVHIAAMKGKVEVLKLLVLACPNAARVILDQNETILHLCVKYGQYETLVMLLGTNIGFEFLNARDSCGNTILHLAVSGTNFEIVKHVVNYDNHNVGILRKKKTLQLNAENAEGHTALDIVLLAKENNYNAKNAEGHTASDKVLLSKKNSYKNFLNSVNCKRAKDVVQHDWLSKKRDTLMVVASLIATVAFQAVVSPPAGVWPDTRDGHRAGEAVMAYNHSHYYPYFIRANTVSFVASLSLILFLISDVPFKNRFYMWCLVVIMWLTVTATAITYGFSIIVVAPKKEKGHLSSTIMVGVIVWCSVMVVLLFSHSVMLLKGVWDDFKIKYEAEKNVNTFGQGDQATDKSEQPEEVYAYAAEPKLPAYDSKSDGQHEIQMGE